MSGKRIDFIDLAKGVCIILVVIGHCGVSVKMPGFEIVRMPLYFLLSGLFYKDYGGLSSLFVKKINKIIVPFLFFYLLSYLLFYALKFLAPSLLVTEAKGILDLFCSRQFFNGPIWFLLALFWCSIYYYFIEMITKWLKINYYLGTSILVIIGGLIGLYLGANDIFVPLFCDVAMTAMPFFYFGIILKRSYLLYPSRLDRYNWLLFVVFCSLSVIVSMLFNFRMSLHYNIIQGFATYLLSALSVLAILILCKMIKKLPIISYMGRYSLVVLCVHHLYYRPIKVVLNGLLIEDSCKVYLTVFLTILLSLASIPICLKLIPSFVAQKDIFKWKRD